MAITVVPVSLAQIGVPQLPASSSSASSRLPPPSASTNANSIMVAESVEQSLIGMSARIFVSSTDEFRFNAVRNQYRRRGLKIYACVGLLAATAVMTGKDAMGQHPVSMKASNDLKALGPILLEARSMEIKKMRPEDNDLNLAVDSLAKSLKSTPELQTTVVLSCPPRPGPKPRGSRQNTLAIASAEGWSTSMPKQVDLSAEKLFAASDLSAGVKSVMKSTVVPQFKLPGGNDKFETTFVPRCPGPGPLPSGKGEADKTVKP